uniref:ABC transporter domain-containing protein n=1 Tax=Leersia perrieri TaxID=77586 RepID=A0A0D9WRY9_9ORYZ
MEISNEEMMEMAIVEQLPPSSHHNGGSVEVDMEEDHLWPAKDGPLPIFLKFENVEYKVKLSPKNPLTAARVAFASHKNTEDQGSCKHILKGIGGSVDPGEILALMGPSGSGKTTLLKILGGRLSGGVKGQITYNDTPYSPCLKRRIGFVTQDDVLFPQLTVEETLVFAAFLRLPARMSKQQKRDRVDAIITELNLERCRHTKIGGAFVRGVSGGERKRTSIGYEILVDPSLLLLDEPTSGLDSTSASKLLVVLRRLARSSPARRTIITTIHQPSSRMFHMFDKLLLLAEGHAIYHGCARGCMPHFAALGFVPGIPMNPAEFLLDLATGNLDGISSPADLLLSVASLESSLEFRSNVIKYLQMKHMAVGEEATAMSGGNEVGRQLRLAVRMRKERCGGISWAQQFVVLSRRTFRERAADYLDKMRLAQAVGVALLLGLLWWKSQTSNEAQLRDQLYLVKERKADMYRLSAYYASSTLCDAVPHVVYPVLFMAILYFMADLRRTLPCFCLTLLATLLIVFTSQGTGELLGAAILSVKRAGVMASLVLMLFLLTGGYYVQHIPKFIRWLKYVSFMHYGFNLLLKAQYHGHLTYNCGSRGGCQRLQSSPSFGTVDLDGGMREVWILLAMALAYRLLAYLCLRKRISLMPFSGPRYVVGCRSKVDKEKLIAGTRVDPVVYNMLHEDPGNVSYSAVGGLSDQIRELRESIELPLMNPELFLRVGIKPPKGVLLYGPPGTGKTLLARAIASNIDANFLKIVSSAIIDKYIGESARLIREMFNYAREHQPCIIFMDEIDAIGGRRFSEGTSADREIQRTLMELLNQLDGFDELGKVKMIMATNRPDVLDPALLRPGRLDRKIEIPLPNEQSRMEVLKIHAAGIAKHGEIDYEAVVKLAEGFNGADLRNVCTEAGMAAIRAERDYVIHEDFMKAVRKLNDAKKLESSAHYSADFGKE